MPLEPFPGTLYQCAFPITDTRIIAFVKSAGKPVSIFIFAGIPQQEEKSLSPKKSPLWRFSVVY